MPLYLTHLKDEAPRVSAHGAFSISSPASAVASALALPAKASQPRRFWSWFYPSRLIVWLAVAKLRVVSGRSWPKGFTVMEMIVVLAVFSVVVVSATDIFFTVNRAHRRLISTQSVQRDMRFALETMVRELHQGSIDYNYYSSQGIALKVNDQVQGIASLALHDPSDRVVRFRVLDQDGTGANLKLQVSRGLVDDWQNLLSDNIKLVMAKFYVVPESDPFVASVSAPNQPPRVTLMLSAQSLPASAQDQPVNFFLQTTIVSRNYKR